MNEQNNDLFYKRFSLVTKCKRIRALNTWASVVRQSVQCIVSWHDKYHVSFTAYEACKGREFRFSFYGALQLNFPPQPHPRRELLEISRGVENAGLSFTIKWTVFTLIITSERISDEHLRESFVRPCAVPTPLCPWRNSRNYRTDFHDFYVGELN
jgi:hypothetical protein